ncbi:flagellar biosynthetic protein FliR [Thalassoglobus sp. JC818]|uniref:flagellar biosynthetic protein FliR n=1 Tax=Thalassoglobus sp. JC818 TaxID=3232136 RepID=UPI0034597AF7
MTGLAAADSLAQVSSSTDSLITLGVTVLLLNFVRISAFVAFLPILGRKPVPNTVKIGFAVCLMLIWIPTSIHAAALQIGQQNYTSWSWLTWHVLREAAFGIASAWCLGLLLVPIRIAGSVIAQEMGLTLASMTSSTSDAQSNVISEILETAFSLGFLALNGHYLLLYFLDSSLYSIPIAQPCELPNLQWTIQTILETDGVGVAVSSPVLLCLLATTTALLMIMRQTPQFNLMTFGMPIRLIVGLVALIVFLPDIIHSALKVATRWTHSI